MSLELFVEHLTGEPVHANEDLFRHLVSTLPPRRQEAVLLHFRDGLPYKTVGEKLDGITSSRAMQLAEMGVRRIRERIAMDTGIVPLPVDKPEHGEVIRTVIAGTVEDYQALIEAKQQRKAAAEARALEGAPQRQYRQSDAHPPDASHPGKGRNYNRRPAGRYDRGGAAFPWSRQYEEYCLSTWESWPKAIDSENCVC